MNWQGREILPLRHRYNCQVNDDVYPPPLGWLGKVLLRLHHARHNVPTEGFRSSERSIEVPLALDFIAHAIGDESLLELGCVLPYYILKKDSHRVYDLTDSHPQCERKDIRELAEVEFKANIISISTLEHIDEEEYGIAQNGKMSGLDVLKKIVNSASRYFVTFPLGCNRKLDEYVLAADHLGEAYVSRDMGDPNNWHVVSKEALTPEMRHYGTYLRANTICVVSKYQ